LEEIKMDEREAPRPEEEPHRLVGPSRRRYNRPSFFFPLLLIALGVIFLLRNTGVITGDVWGTILRMWPLILVAIGVDSLFQRQGIVGPVFWITLGGVLLLANFDVLEVNVFQVIISLWPLLLIAIGLDLVIGRRSWILSVLSVVILIGVMVGALWFVSPTLGAQPAQGEVISRPLDGAERGLVNLNPSVGALQVRPLEEGELFAEGVVRLSRGERLVSAPTTSDGTARLTLMSEGVSFLFPIGQRDRWSWDLGFHQGVPLDMVVNMGVGEVLLDLREMEVERLDLSMGVGRIRVILPQEGRLNADISSGVGETIIIVPAGVQARINASPALAVVDMPPTYERLNDVYTSPNYGAAGQEGGVLELNLSHGVGRLAVFQE
jgi:hypothetical protein